MTNEFTVDDLIDLPPDVKRIFKESYPNIRFTHNAELVILLLLQRTYKGQSSQVLFANTMKRCIELNNSNNAIIINDTEIKSIIDDEALKLNSPSND